MNEREPSRRLIPRDPDAFGALVAALVKGAKARRRGPRRRTVPKVATGSKPEVARRAPALTRKRRA